MCQEEIIMELKAIIAIGLVLFIIGGLIFLKSEAGRNNSDHGAAMRGRPFTYQKRTGKEFDFR